MSSLAHGRYSLAEVLGEGGMATVYRAYDERLQVWRAIKLISPELAEDAALRERFLVEARAMARLSHPHIVAVHDIRPDERRPFIVMEWVGGGDLEAHVRAHGPLPPRQAVEVLAAVLDALEAAHEAEVIHRDIKPQNVLLTEKGVPKVGDFGVARVLGAAKLTRTGSAMGTWAYMAPEQRSASALDHRADLYAAGATLYFAVTGELPVDLFASGLDASLLQGVPESLRAVVRRACAYRPDERYGSAEEMQGALLALTETLPPLPEGCPPLGALAKQGAPPVAQAGGTLVPGAGTLIPGAALGGGTLIPESALGSSTLIPESALGSGTLIPESKPGGGTLIPESVAPASSPAWPPTEDLASVKPAPPSAHTLEHHTFFKAGAAPEEEEEEEEEDWDPGAGRWPLLALVVVLLLLAAGVAWRAGGDAPTDGAPATPSLVEPTAPTPPPVEEAAPVTPAAPEQAEEEPPEAAKPRAEVKRSSTSSRGEAAETPSPEPLGRQGEVRALGDAKRVLLEDLSGERHLPGVLPAGRYSVLASFGSGDLVSAGKLTLADGQRVTLRCDSRFMLCRVE